MGEFSEILAYFITWTCYGTHLPGDDDGWTKWHGGNQLPQPLLRDWCQDRLIESPSLLDSLQRQIVSRTIREVCETRSWKLHAVNCRTTHCHVVLTANGYAGDLVRDQLKAWSTRRLKEQQESRLNEPLRSRWWTSKGSVRKLFEENSLEAAIVYTTDAQDFGGSKGKQ